MNIGKLKEPEKECCKLWENVKYGNIKVGFYCI
jgi:hypothetical protein